MAAPWGFARSSARPALSVLLLTTELSLQLLPLPLGSLLADPLLDRPPAARTRALCALLAVAASDAPASPSSMPRRPARSLVPCGRVLELPHGGPVLASALAWSLP
jgi:hypothetical protein